MIILLFLAFWYFPIFYKAIYNFEYQNLKRLAFFLNGQLTAHLAPGINSHRVETCLGLPHP